MAGEFGQRGDSGPGTARQRSHRADQRLTEIARKLRDAGVPGGLAGAARRGVRRPADRPRPRHVCVPGAGTDCAGDSGCAASLSGSVNLTMPLAAGLASRRHRAKPPDTVRSAADDCREPGRSLAGRKRRQVVPDAHRSRRPSRRPRLRPGQPRQPGSIRTWLAKVKLTRIECGTCTHERQSRAYRPPEMMRHLVYIRQRTCAFPGCRRPAERCDLDHTTPFDQGGRTCECNLSPFVQRHHQTKQAPGWQLLQPEPGTLVWTAPHARTYTTQPGIYPAS